MLLNRPQGVLKGRERPERHVMDGMNQLGDVLCWRETRRVSQQLVVHYSRMKFTLHPSEITARLAGQAVEVYDFPDGRLEIRWRGPCLPDAVFDKLQRVSHAAIVENKRLGEGTFSPAGTGWLPALLRTTGVSDAPAVSARPRGSPPAM